MDIQKRAVLVGLLGLWLWFVILLALIFAPLGWVGVDLELRLSMLLLSGIQRISLDR